jgi:bacteriocin-like protein
MADEHVETQSESTPPVTPETQTDPVELTEDELEKVSGGLAGSCATGKHIDKATLTP